MLRGSPRPAGGSRLGQQAARLDSVASATIDRGFATMRNASAQKNPDRHCPLHRTTMMITTTIAAPISIQVNGFGSFTIKTWS